MSLFKKLVLAGVFSAVISLGIAGIGTASADGGDWHDNPCVVQPSGAINPACWQGVVWGGVANGWAPQFGYFNNAYGSYWQTYYFLNFYNPYYYQYYNYYNVIQPAPNQPCLNGNSGFWNNGYWVSCATDGYWSNGTWYPYWH